MTVEEKVNVLISEEEVSARIKEMAAELSRKYRGRTVHLVGILKGSVMFMSELSKHMTIPVTMDFHVSIQLWKWYSIIRKCYS